MSPIYHKSHSLEDTLIQATDYALCVQTVAHQAILLQPKSPASILMVATMHELEALRVLLEAALIQAQIPAEPRTLHEGLSLVLAGLALRG
ncbi:MULTISPECIES: hypothetical protein [unclassified Pseudomonas]|uniref:hypothetical protein n=1 Tax=unclassified Pseudomonas TaxID=196821 RepID=UPI00067C9C6C|nr:MULTISPECIES: hypothetical protein [unclassified Pseudomonas]RAS27667.1 hypothetical protein H040_02297 [Pseudomonas sp. URMO17WK12:I7]SMF75060.1 hypothetical protein SAMN02745903_05376 [Pseudomonas sp. URMO17WK12:I5]